MPKVANNRHTHKEYSMVLIILIGIMLLFVPGVIPIVGPFFAGIIIGYLSKEVKRGIIASLTSAIIFTIIVWTIVSLVAYPYIYTHNTKIFGTITGFSILALIGSILGFYEVILVVIGAILGAALGDKSKN